MKAAVIATPGAAPVYDDFPDQEPRGPEVSMHLVAAGIHPIVRSLAAGQHYGSQDAYPMVPGVDAVAADPTGALSYTGFVRAPWGTFAESFAARIGTLLPSGADPVQIAGSLNPGLSGWLPLKRRVLEIDSLSTVLVVGATGAAGRLAVQCAFRLGADRVIGVGRDADRLADVARFGGIPVALSDGPVAIASALDGRAPSIILDYVWGPAAESVWESLRRGGLDEDTADISHVQIGSLGGRTAALPADLLRSRRITVRGSGAGSAPLAEIMAELGVFIQEVASGAMEVSVRAFPLSRIAEAWAYRGPARAVVVPG